MLKEVLEMLFGAKVISQHCLLLDFLLDRICHVTRLAKFDLCGAIFAPTNGWTSDDDEATISSTHDIMQKINLLAIATVGHSPSLRCTDSIYGLNILHILLAFHASPYPVIKKVLESYPDCVAVKSVKDGYTPLDIHYIRRTIPNEVRKEELDVSFKFMSR